MAVTTADMTTAPAPAAAPESVEIPVAPAEVRALGAVQRRIGRGPVVATARAMSLFGEHAGGWLALGFYGVTFAGALTSALTRSFEPLPKSDKPRAKPRTRKPVTA